MGKTQIESALNRLDLTPGPSEENDGSVHSSQQSQNNELLEEERLVTE